MVYERCRVFRPSMTGRSTSVTVVTAERSVWPSGSRTAPCGSFAADSLQPLPVRPLLHVRPPIVIVSTVRDCPSKDMLVGRRDLSGMSSSPFSLQSKERLTPLLVERFWQRSALG